MNKEMKSCPKCGGRNLIHQPVVIDGLTLWIVACEDCGYYGDPGLNTELADIFWNTESDV